MRLTRVDIEGYRGIDRLSIGLDGLTTVIGEPDGGKSSLLRAIGAVLGPRGQVGTSPIFHLPDFHVPAGEDTRVTRLSITLWLRLDAADLDMAPDATLPRGEGALRVRADLPETGEPVTSLEVLDTDGATATDIDAASFLAELQRRYPAVIVGRPRPFTTPAPAPHADEHPAGTRLRDLLRGPSEPAGPLTWAQIEDVRGDLLRAAARIADQLPAVPAPPRSVRQLADIPRVLETDLAHALGAAAGRQRRLPALWLLVAIVSALPPEGLADDAEPILLFDDIEANLHPTWLAALCSVAINLPFQEIVTTHSSEVLAWLPLSSLRRLVRGPDGIEARAVHADTLSDDDLRRLTFHVRLNRGGSLFARCWVLVEGETESWLVPELARLSGVELPVEGIRCVEFAQSGLGPLLRVANDLGIGWIVLTDGDTAGQHYAQTARRIVAAGGRGQVIVLPDVDIEHYLYRHGYAEVIAEAARRPARGRPRPVIAAAVANVSKPGLALRILAEAVRRGPEGVPPILRELAEAAVLLARGAASGRRSPASGRVPGTERPPSSSGPT